MERDAVTSSNIESIGYDAKTKTLEVEFRGGKVYQYAGVPKKIFEDVKNAPSVGRALNMKVKDRFRCEQADE